MMLLESAGIAGRAYGSAEEFLARPESEHPDFIILALRLPGMNGLQLLQQLRTEMIDTPVIVVSAYADVPSTVRAMKLGAVDLLEKPVDATVMRETIERSLALGQSLRRKRDDAEQVRRRFERLTARELELLQFIVEGHLSKQIAVEMGISVKTVANHRANLMTKTGASNAADLARLFTTYKSSAPPSGDSAPPRQPPG